MGRAMSQPVINLASYMSRSTANFSGRKWVFEAIDAWLVGPKGEHRFLLTGMPDTGKTVLAVHLVRFSLGTPQPADCNQFTVSILSPWRFCSARNLLIGPHFFAGTQASQLAARYPLFKQVHQQKSDEDRTITITSIQNIERLIGGQMTDIGIDNVNVRNIPHLDTFNRVVREMLGPYRMATSRPQVFCNGCYES